MLDKREQRNLKYPLEKMKIEKNQKHILNCQKSADYFSTDRRKSSKFQFKNDISRKRLSSDMKYYNTGYPPMYLPPFL